MNRPGRPKPAGKVGPRINMHLGYNFSARLSPNGHQTTGSRPKSFAACPIIASQSLGGLISTLLVSSFYKNVFSFCVHKRKNGTSHFIPHIFPIIILFLVGNRNYPIRFLISFVNVTQNCHSIKYVFGYHA